MSEQRTLASVVYDRKKKVMRRERFLREMDAVIPWGTLRALVAPHYTNAGRGRRPLPFGTLRRVYFRQQWFNLSDPAAEDMRYDSASMRRCARVDLGEDTVPDASTILRFRHRQTRKGKSWSFGTKCHIGTDPHGLVHTLRTTDAAQADITQLPELVHGMEESVHGDKAYWKDSDREAYEALGGQYLVNQRGEHPFLVVKTLWGFTKVRYRGLYKNTVRALAAFALANLYQVRYRLMAHGT